MEKERIAEINDNVLSLVKEGRLKEAITTLSEDVNKLQDWSLCTRFSQMQTSYNYLLEYLCNGTPDPAREAMYKNLKAECVLLNDEIAISRLAENPTSLYLQYKRKYNNLDELEELYKALCKNTEDRELAQIMQKDGTVANTTAEDEHEQLLDTIFSMIWCSTSWRKSDAELIARMIDDNSIEINDRAIIITAITMSLLKLFEPVKVNALINTILNAETMLAVRATVGVLMVLHENHDKIEYFPSIIAAIESMGEDERAKRFIETVQIQLLYCRETVKIDRKMREEIIPAMLKNPNFNKEKLGIDIINDSDDDKNPEWEKWIESSNIKKKLEELSKWQDEGADLYISTFSQLKRFPFFNNMKNWLRPFTHKIPAISKAMPRELLSKNSLLKKIFSSTVFCNSDKFSFCLTFQSVPKEQMDLLTNEMLEYDEERKSYGVAPHLSNAEQEQAISNMYIQDLYRFFKLSGFRHEFQDPFANSLNLLDCEYLTSLVSTSETLLRIFNHLTNKGYYSEAIDAGLIYETGDYERKEDTTALFYQEMGYCLQKESRYDEAIKYYTRADIIKADNPWTLQHIAQCHRLLMEPENALKFYLQAEEINPDSLPLLRQTGECLAMLERYDEAFARFFKVEYLKPDNANALRAIAWCSFLAGKMEQARNYYQKIFKLQQCTFTDYMNAAHVEWVGHNNKQATELYNKAKELCGNNEKFLKTFNNDIVELYKHGVSLDEINMLRDLVM